MKYLHFKEYMYKISLNYCRTSFNVVRLFAVSVHFLRAHMKNLKKGLATVP